MGFSFLGEQLFEMGRKEWTGIGQMEQGTSKSYKVQEGKVCPAEGMGFSTTLSTETARGAYHKC